MHWIFQYIDFNMQDMQNICKKKKCTKMHKKGSEYAVNMQNMHKSMYGIFCKILQNMPPHLLMNPACCRITVGTARQADGLAWTRYCVPTWSWPWIPYGDSDNIGSAAAALATVLACQRWLLRGHHDPTTWTWLRSCNGPSVPCFCRCSL